MFLRRRARLINQDAARKIICGLTATALSLTACGTADQVETSRTTTAHPTESATAAAPMESPPPPATDPPATTTQASPDTSLAPPSTASTTTPPTELPETSCPLPALLPDGLEPWISEIHAATNSLASGVNRLGQLLPDVPDFSPGWGDRDPIAGTVSSLTSDADRLDEIITGVLESAGATYSTQEGWQFPEGTDISPDHPMYGLEEIHAGARYLTSDVMPSFLATASGSEAVNYFDNGAVTASPCGVALSLVEAIDHLVSLAS